MSTFSIPLSKRGKYAGLYVAIIDEIDSDLLEGDWHVRHDLNTQYAQRSIVGQAKKQLLHRVILSRMLGRELAFNERVDHINSNGLDNRRENLRLATHQQNMANQPMHSNNKSGYKGVHWAKHEQYWVAQICVNYKKIWLGRFDTPEEAYQAYCDATKRLHGEFARLE